MTKLKELQISCQGCRQCQLCETRNSVVFGVGKPTADIMFIGEAPGQQEDLQGEPFVGPAGQLLDDMLLIIDLSRENCYIANTVKCRPPRNRDPQDGEMLACSEWLHRQISLIQPKIIICLGRISAKQFISPDFRITREHGQWTQRDGVWYMATYHPSALLRDPGKRPEAFDDLKVLQAKIKELDITP